MDIGLNYILFEIRLLKEINLNIYSKKGETWEWRSILYLYDIPYFYYSQFLQTLIYVCWIVLIELTNYCSLIYQSKQNHYGNYYW